MPLTLDQFSAQLTGGNLLPAEDVSRLREQHQPADAEQFARLLVKQKLLTAYQAQQAYAGKAGSLVLGNYVLLDKLGQGGMGMVLKARHRRMNRIVALKILSPAVTKTPEAMKRFQREVEAAARLHHPNIVTAYDADEVKGTHFLVMEYVEGTDLSVLTKKKGPLPVDQAVTCVMQAARGLEFAHKHGIVHRDIKPANLLLDEQGTVKILDMGLARIEGETGSQAELTSTGAVMGTVDYMAPEQAMNTKSADARSDIYSLGVTLWFLLTGRPVYEGDSLMARLIGHRETPIPSLRGVRGEVPTALDDLFRRMVAKQPQDRFQSMTEVLAALEACRGGASATSTPSIALGPSEESKLSEFIGIFGGATDPAAPTRTAKSLRAAATDAASRAASVSSPYEATVTSASASEGTDPQTLTTLSRGSPRPDAAGSRPASSSGKLTWLLGGIAAAFALVAAVVLSQSSQKDQTTTVPAPVAQGQPADPMLRRDVVPAAMTSETPKASFALEFDGNESRVECPPLDIPGRELTFEAWVVSSPKEVPETLPVYQAGDSSISMNARGPYWVLDFWNTEGRWQGVTDNSNSRRGVLCHLAATVSEQECRLYLDGRHKSTRSASIAMGDVERFWSVLSKAPLFIGYRKMTPEGKSRSFLGQIWQFRVSSGVRYRNGFEPPARLERDPQTLALYRFDEGEGDVLHDSSGHNRHGKITAARWVKLPGGPSPESSSPVDRSLDFDGKGYVQLPAIDFTKLDALTLEATVRVLYPPGKDPTGNPFGSYFSDKERYGLGLMAKERGLILEVGTQVKNGTAGHEIVLPGSPWGKGPFQVAATVDRKGKSLAFYVDGRLIERKPLTGEFNGGPTPLMLGADPGLEGKANNFFAGQVDEVRISDNVRYTADYEPVRRFDSDDHTLALYHCDEGSGDVLTDSSGHERHGKAVRAKWVAASALTGIRPPLPAAGSSPKSATDAATFDPVARLNSAGQDDAYPWILPEALKIYFTREAEGLESATYSATRKSADEPFGTPRRELSGRMLVVTGDDLYGVLLPGNYGVGKTLFETSRSSVASPWGEPRPIASLASFTNAKSPWISDDGLTLVFQRQKTTSPIAASSSEFVISRRTSRMAAWETPELLAMSPDPALDDVLTWPQLSPDQRTLCFCVGGTRAPRVFFATKGTSDGPFRDYAPVVVEGQPVTGRAPRWLPGRSELFLSRDPDAAVKDSNLQVIRGVRPKE